MLGEPMPVIFESDGDIYKRSGISFAALKHLDAIGLISFESVAGYQATATGKRILVHYFGTPTVLEFPTDDPQNIQVGKALLTTIGKELVAICGAQRNQEFYDYVLTHWRDQSIIVNGTGKVSEP